MKQLIIKPGSPGLNRAGIQKVETNTVLSYKVRILSLKKRRPRCNGGQLEPEPGRKAFGDEHEWGTSVTDVVQDDGVMGRSLDKSIGFCYQELTMSSGFKISALGSKGQGRVTG